jgi:phosphatidylinositol alpha-1,6-mannosyltransferase
MMILLLAQVFPPAKGGSGRWFWELYRRLPGMPVHVVAGQVDGAEAFDRAAGLPVSRLALDFSSWGILNWRSVFQYVRAFFALRRIVSGVQPDVVHCGKCLPEGLLALALERWSGTPFCCYVHGEELTLAKTSKDLGPLTRRVLRRARTIIANSDHTKNILLSDWAAREDRVVVMHPGVDTSRFMPAPQSPEVRRRLGWTNRRVILTVGALQKRKGQDMMIRALSSLRKRCPDVLYSIVGEGWERSYLDGVVAECQAEPFVEFRSAPTDDELVELYQQCDLFALPNRRVGWDFEGFGIALLEAQACGKAVIAGRSGGTAEAIQPGRSGELVSCETSEELAAAALTLLEDPGRRAVMGACGRQWVIEYFDWNGLSRQAAEVFSADASPI